MEPKLVPARLRDHDGLTFPMLPTLLTRARVVKRKRGQNMMLYLDMVHRLCLIHFAKYTRPEFNPCMWFGEICSCCC